MNRRGFLLGGGVGLLVGFDIERHVYGDHRYPAQLVIQDVTTLHGSQFRDATLIVASPPCQQIFGQSIVRLTPEGATVHIPPSEWHRSLPDDIVTRLQSVEFDSSLARIGDE